MDVNSIYFWAYSSLKTLKVAYLRGLDILMQEFNKFYIGQFILLLFFGFVEWYITPIWPVINIWPKYECSWQNRNFYCHYCVWCWRWLVSQSSLQNIIIRFVKALQWLKWCSQKHHMRDTKWWTISSHYVTNEICQVFLTGVMRHLWPFVTPQERYTNWMWYWVSYQIISILYICVNIN